MESRLDERTTGVDPAGQRLLADAAETDPFDKARAAEAAALRAKSVERLQHKVAGSLERMHAVLTAEQRAQLAYLLRTGTITM